MPLAQELKPLEIEEYVDAVSLEMAVRALADGAGTPVAGGTDLWIQKDLGKRAFGRRLVNIRRVAGLGGIAENGGRVRIGALATMTSLLVVAPWTARNCAVMDGCAFVSTNAGWNLAIGSSPRATGRFEPLRAEDGCTIVTGQVQQDRCWRDQGLAWISADPVRWISLAPKKLAFTFDHQSFAVGYLAQADPGAWPEGRRAAWRARLGAVQYGLLLLAALGAVLVPVGRKRDVALAAGLGAALVLFADGVLREAPRIWPLVLAVPVLAFLPPFDRRDRGVVRYLAFCLLTLIVVHGVFFGEDRYQIVLTPALVVLAAAALRWVDAEPVV